MDTVLEFSQRMDFITVLVMCVPLMAVSLCGLLLTNDKKRYAMQRYVARLYNVCKTLHNYLQLDNCEQHQYQQPQSQSLQLQEQQVQQQHEEGRQFDQKQQQQQRNEQQLQRQEYRLEQQQQLELDQQEELLLQHDQQQQIEDDSKDDESSDSGIGISVNQEEQQPRQKTQQLQQQSVQTQQQQKQQQQQLEQLEQSQQQQCLQQQSHQQSRSNQRKLHGSNYSRRCTSSNGKDAKIKSTNNDLNSSSSNEDLSGATTVTICSRTEVHKRVNKKSQKNKNNKQKQRQQQQLPHSQPQPQQLPQQQSQSQLQHQNPDPNKLTKPNNSESNSNNSTSNLDDESKENFLLIINGVTKKSIKTNDCRVTLRKICTKTNALRAVSNRNIKRTTLTSAKVKVTVCSSSMTDDVRSSSPSPSTSSSSLSSLSSLSSSSNSNSPVSSSNSSPTSSPIVGKRNTNTESLMKVLKDLPPSWRSHYYYKQRRDIFNIAEGQLYQILENYLVKPDDLPFYGFPVESQHEKGCVEIFKLIPKHMAKEYIKSDTKQISYYFHYYGNVDNEYKNRDEREKEFKAKVAFVTPDLVEHKFTDYANSKQKSCLRCQKMFSVSADGEYLTKDPCIYHPGKVNAFYDGKNYIKMYTCCHGEENSEGCTKHDHHIWSGLFIGMNGPYKNFVHTKLKHRPPKVYALDCEMCYTGFGPELTKITIVAHNGKIIYDHYVLPQSRIIDYCTRYSGVSESDLFSPHSPNEVKTLNQVQQDVLELFDANTILIGHGLENDLRALRLVHKKIVDTSIVFSHTRGYPYRQSLKNLTKSFLNHDIQESEDGHCSQEDALATLNLMLFKIQQTLWQEEMKREAPHFSPT